MHHRNRMEIEREMENSNVSLRLHRRHHSLQKVSRWGLAQIYIAILPIRLRTFRPLKPLRFGKWACSEFSNACGEFSGPIHNRMAQPRWTERASEPTQQGPLR